MVIEVCDDKGTRVCLSDSIEIDYLHMDKDYKEEKWYLSFHARNPFITNGRQEQSKFSVTLRYSCEGKAREIYNRIACHMGLNIMQSSCKNCDKGR